MNVFTKVIPLIAIVALLALMIFKPAHAHGAADCTQSQHRLVLTTVFGREIETNVLCFDSAHEAVEAENVIKAHPVARIPGKKPHKFLTYVVSRIFTK